VIDEVARLLLADAGWAIQIRVRAVGEDLRKGRVEVEGVGCRDAVGGL